MFSVDVWVSLACIVPGLTFAASYTYCIINKDLKYPDYYLSNTIAYPPESMIGSFGLGASTVFLLPVIYLRYRFIDHKVPEYACSNFAAWVLGSICSFGVMGVGAVQYPNSNILHVICADLTFFGFTCYELFQTYYMDPALMKMDPMYKRGWWRIATSVISPIAVVVMFSEKRGFHAENLAAPIAEMALVGGFVLWLSSLIGSFGDLHFELHPVNRNNLQESLLHERGLRPVAVSEVGEHDFPKKKLSAVEATGYRPPTRAPINNENAGDIAVGGLRSKTKSATSV